MNHQISSPRASAGALPHRGTVFVVDDDESHLRSMARFLRAAGFQVATYGAAAEFLKVQRPNLRGCVITDLVMPGMDGLALQEALHRAGSSLPVLFLTGLGDIPATVRAMRRGAEDFLTKDAPKEDLIAAVNRALTRNERDRSRHADLLAFCERLALLTDREREVLKHVLRGKLNKQIAADLGIHERTVKLHRTNLTNKLQVHSVAELARLAREADEFQSDREWSAILPPLAKNP